MAEKCIEILKMKLMRKRTIAIAGGSASKFAENARKLIEEEYTYEAAVERYRKILGKIR